MQTYSDKPAMLVLDMQNRTVAHFRENTELLSLVGKAVEAARQHDIPIVFVRVAFSTGYPEVSPRNKVFSHVRQIGDMTVSDHATQIHESLQPKNGEPVVTKFRVSAFTGSNLEVILRSRQINSLILTGVGTSGAVLSTLREAADKDYAITVLADACADPDPEVHRVLIEKVFPRQADILTVDAWINKLHSHKE